MNWFDTNLGKAQLRKARKAVAKQQTTAVIPRGRARNGEFRQRMYATARPSRLALFSNASNTSADAELVSSLTSLRARARALVRDASYAKRARTVIVNNVIGSGIGMQAQVRGARGELNDRVNDEIEERWSEWSQGYRCHTGGRLSFQHLERALMGQVVDAGDVFVRKHNRPFGDSEIPFALEMIEAERIADEFASVAQIVPGANVRMGVEVDDFYRPLAYWIRQRHPGEIRFNIGGTDRVERVRADLIIPLFLIDRWPQTRGEPWAHTVITRMRDVDGYSEAEITRARVQACSVGAIQTPEDSTSFGEEQSDGTVEMEVEPGVFKRLNPGETLSAAAPSSPNPQLAPFMQHMLRELSRGYGVSYESLSGDYSQSNYSSSRLALIDDRDLFKFYQSWFICDFRYPVHREWLRQAVLSRVINSISIEEYAVNPRQFEAVRFKPRGWTWVDPTKEVEAYKEAIRAGLTTRTDVIAATAGGQDIEDIDDIRAQELKEAQEKDLQFDTDPEYYMSDAAKALAESKAIAEAAVKPPPDKNTDADENSDPPGRVVSFLR